MNINALKKLKTALPEFPNVMGKERYFNAAVLVPLIVVDNEYHLLFQKRAPFIRQGSEICFPGGKFEPEVDIDFMNTAVRETVEELGIPQESICVEGRFDTLLAPLGVTVEPFLATLSIENLNQLSPDPSEVERVFTIPVDYFKKNPPEEYAVKLEVHSTHIDKEGNEETLLPVKELELPERYHTPWGGKKYRILVYKTEEGVIWGITAEIIHDLIRKL